MVFHGSAGVVECGWNCPQVIVAGSNDREPRWVAAEGGEPNIALESFLREVGGDEPIFSSQDVLNATRITLTIQEAADKGLCDVML
jgi:hypothetical protein